MNARWRRLSDEPAARSRTVANASVRSSVKVAFQFSLTSSRAVMSAGSSGSLPAATITVTAIEPSSCSRVRSTAASWSTWHDITTRAPSRSCGAATEPRSVNDVTAECAERAVS
jgi:hypothetical protein